MIDDGNLKELLLSPRSKKNQNGYYTCSCCFSGMQPKMIRNKFPPKFAIAHGFVIGSMPQGQQWTTADGDKKSRVIAEHEFNDLLKAMMAPVRPYGLIFSYTGGAQKSLRGNNHFFRWIRTELGGVIHQLNKSGIGEQIY
jgi:hypothetical protein